MENSTDLNSILLTLWPKSILLKYLAMIQRINTFLINEKTSTIILELMKSRPIRYPNTLISVNKLGAKGKKLMKDMK
jgi:hypothetical protein